MYSTPISKILTNLVNQKKQTRNTLKYAMKWQDLNATSEIPKFLAQQTAVKQTRKIY